MNDDSYTEQLAVAAVLKMLRSKRGATVAEIAKARKSEEQASKERCLVGRTPAGEPRHGLAQAEDRGRERDEGSDGQPA